MAINAILLPHDTDRFALRTLFDRAFVEALKAAIPPGYREWDPGKKLWVIDDAYDDTVIQLVQGQGGQVSDKRPQVAPAAPVPPRLQEACAVLCITPEMPLAIAETVFKGWARIHHPDVGGDTQKMQALNKAIEDFRSFTEVPF